jgi:hypothetical protein
VGERQRERERARERASERERERERERGRDRERGREREREGGRERVRKEGREGGRERERESERARERERGAYHISSIGWIRWSPTSDQSAHGQKEHFSHFICIAHTHAHAHAHAHTFTHSHASRMEHANRECMHGKGRPHTERKTHRGLHTDRQKEDGQMDRMKAPPAFVLAGALSLTGIVGDFRVLLEHFPMQYFEHVKQLLFRRAHALRRRIRTHLAGILLMCA